MQQIPKNRLPEGHQDDYRSCFSAGPEYKDWKIVASDYASQELAVIGTLSQDPIFLDALQTGKDLHSTCAEIVYGKIWEDAADKDCAFYALDKEGNKAMQKCKCKRHGELRVDVKTLNFGLAYGMTEIALSNDLKIDVSAAKELMNKFFLSFPNIKSLLDSLGNYGTSHGYSRTIAPMRRKRYYPYWKGLDTSKYLMGKIDRASKNAPIQG